MVVAGGVSASAVLKQKVLEALLGVSESKNEFVSGAREGELRVFFPERRFAGDNAAMVGAAAYFEIRAGVEPTDPYKLDIMPRSAIS